MPLRYFQLIDAPLPGAWELGDPTDSRGQEMKNPWRFIQGEPLQADAPLKIPLSCPGTPLDFTLAGVGVAPVIHAKGAVLFAQLAPEDVQLVAVQVASRPEPYFLVNATRIIRCIDDQASAQVQHWKAEDGLPQKTGMYRDVHGMRIDLTPVGQTQVFRTWGWTSALIVSEAVKEAFERAGLTGLAFREVTGPSARGSEEHERHRKLRELREQTTSACEAFWRTLGRLEEDIIISMGGGSGPERRYVWRVIHRPQGRTLLVTEGLSGYFVGGVELSAGFGLELALETDEALTNAERSWPLRLLERVGDEVAGHEPVRERLKTGSLSLEVSGSGLPERLVTPEGQVGVVLGGQSSTLPGHFTLPTGPVQLITVQVLLPGV